MSRDVQLYCNANGAVVVPVLSDRRAAFTECGEITITYGREAMLHI